MKCPYCKQPIINRIPIHGVDVGEGLTGPGWKGIAYYCPNLSCQAVLSVQIDPVALKADTVAEIAKKIGY